MTSKTHLTAKHSKKIPKWTLKQLLDFDVITRIQPANRTGERFADNFEYSVGYSIAGAAEVLKISRQRIHQLVQSGALDAYELLDDAKHPVGLFITAPSLELLKNSERKPGRKSKIISNKHPPVKVPRLRAP
jgi:hypothetical protein